MNDPISTAKELTVQGKERLLKVLSFVPDEKLTYSPSDTAKGALRIVAHCGVANGALAGMIRGEAMQVSSMAEVFALMEEAEKAVTTREAAIQLLETSSQTVLDSLDSIKPEQVGDEIVSFFGPAPRLFWMNLPGRHMDNHAAQIDYLQTVWGDLEFHM